MFLYYQIIQKNAWKIEHYKRLGRNATFAILMDRAKYVQNLQNLNY